MNPFTLHTLQTLRALLLHRKCLCVLLCLITWRGPVPVLHCHEAMASHGVSVHHLVSYHAGEADEASGWHLHLMLFDDFAPEDSQESRNRKATELLVVPGSVKAAIRSSDLPLHLCVDVATFFHDAADLQSSDFRGAGAYANGENFSTSLFAAKPFCAVTGVLRN